jgi:hypothetical protein
MSNTYFTELNSNNEDVISSFQVTYLNYQDFDNAHIEWHMDQFIQQYFNYTDSQQEQINSHLTNYTSYDSLHESFTITYTMNDNIITWDVKKTRDLNSQAVTAIISCSIIFSQPTYDSQFIKQVSNTVTIVKNKYKQTAETYNAYFLEEQMYRCL